MGRRSTGLALLGLSLALGLPATASAKAKRAVEPYKVLVVTSTSDAVSTAGIAAITSAVGADGVVTAPAPADVGAQFTPTNLDTYRTVVFLNTGMASPLNDAQRANYEAYYKKGGGFVGIGSAVETDASWAFLTGLLGTRSSAIPIHRPATSRSPTASMMRARTCRSTGSARSLYYNFVANVRGVSHVLATVVEKPFEPQPAGNVLKGIAGGTMGANHPIACCKDFEAGRSFYTSLGTSAASFDADLQKHLKGAIAWSAGQSDPTYSDCGATVLKNYQQVKVTQQPNLNEPIGFDQLPDGRIIQTDRRGGVRLHNPATGTTTLIANLGDTALPQTLRVYTNSEDGLYGPAVDPNFATNKWVYLYYAPQTVTDVKLSNGTIVTPDDAERDGPELRAGRVGVGQVHRLLPALALQVRRGRPGCRAWTWTPSSRSCGSPTTARSAATSRATSTSTRTATCGWSPVTTRRPAASTPPATVPFQDQLTTSSRPFAPTTRPVAPSR